MLEPAEMVQGLAPQLGGEVDEVLLLQALAVIGCRPRWERLGGPAPVARGLRHRHRALLDGPDRLPGGAVEDVAEGLLAHLGQGLDRPAVHRDVGQHGRRRQVVVPQAVVHELVVPDALPGGGLHADQALAEEVGPGAVAAVVVVGRRARRQVDVAQLLVGAHGRPHVGLPEVPPGVVLPGLVAVLALLRHRVEDPELLAGAGVEAAHVARGGVLLGGLAVPVDDAGADHHHAAADDGRRGDAVALAVDGPPQAFPQVDEAALAEGRVGPAGPGVDGVEAVAGGAVEHPLQRAAAPVRHASGGAPVALVLPGPGVEGPQLFAAGRVDGAEYVEGGSVVEHPVGHQGGALVPPGPEALGLGDRLVGRGVAPGLPQLVEVAAVDLGQGREAGAGGVGGVRGPLPAPGGAGGQEEQRREARSREAIHGGAINAEDPMGERG